MRLTLYGEKGGSGKSTLAINLGVAYHTQGERVLLVDTDPQGTMLHWASVAAEVGFEGPTVVAMGEGIHKPNMLPDLARHYDRVIIDCPGKLGKIHRQALMVSDVVLLPCGTGGPDVWSLGTSIGLFQQAKNIMGDLEAYVVLNRIKRFTATGRMARNQAETGALPVLDSMLGDRVDFQDAVTSGQGVTSWSPSSAASKELSALMAELDEIERRRNGGERKVG